MKNIYIRSARSGTLCTVLIIVLCMYVNNPFYFTRIERIHKLAYYIFALLPITGFMSFRVSVNKEVVRPLLGALLILGVTPIPLLVNGSTDLSFIAYLLRNIISMLALYSVCHLWRKKYITGKVKIGIIEMYILSVILYICSSIIFLISSRAKDIWMGLIMIYGGGKDLLEMDENVSRFGFSGFSSYTISFQLVCAMILVWYLLYEKKISEKRSAAYIVFLVIGSTFYSRTGLITTITISAVGFMYYIVWQRKVVFFLKSSIFFVASTLILYKARVFLNDRIKNYLDWAFEFVIKRVNSGRFSTRSFEEVKTFYINFSPSLREMLFGNGRWSDGSGGYFGGSDVGFMRYILYGGVFFAILLYIVALAMIIHSKRRMREYIGGSSSVIAVMLILTVCVFELKGDIVLIMLKVMIPIFYGLYSVMHTRVAHAIQWSSYYNQLEESA